MKTDKSQRSEASKLDVAKSRFILLSAYGLTCAIVVRLRSPAILTNFEFNHKA
jgi:hypothetical protein